MALTKITADVLTDNTIVAADLATTGTASSATVLHGNDSWGTVASSGVLNVAASDPGAGQTSGNTWYLSGLLNFVADTNNIAGVWVTAANTLLARRYAASCGIQSAMLSVGGLSDGGISNTAQIFDGSLWNSTTVFPSTARHWTMFGSESAATTVSGELASSNSAVSYEFDGTTWAAAGSISSARTSAGSAGTQTAGLCWCGIGGTGSNLSEEYDGSSWSSTGNYVISSYDSQGGGKQTAAFGVGGQVPPSTVNNTGEYDGSTWSAGGNSVSSVSEAASGGTQTAGLRAAGYTSSPSTAVNTSEEYDGSTWSASRTLLTTRRTVDTGAASQGAGICSNGYTESPGAFSATTELYDKATVQFVAV